MSAGDFYIRKNASDSTGNLPDEGGADLNASWDTLVYDEGSIVTYSSPNLRVDTGLYLIMYSEHFMSDETTNNERIEIQGEIHTGSGIAGGHGQDYIRKSSGVGQDATVSGSMILDVTSDNTDIFIKFYRTDASADIGVHRVAGHGGVTILQLDDTHNYGFYSNSAAQTLSGNTEVDIVLNTNDQQDTGFSRSSNAITISNAGRYFCTYSMKINQTGTGREDIRAHLEIGTTRILGTDSYSYLRGDNNEFCDDGALTWMGIIDVDAGDVITMRIYSHTSLPGSILAGTLSIQFWQLPSSADTAIIEATTGDFNADAVFDWDTMSQIDTDSFTYTNGNSNVDVNQNDHVLVFATVNNDVADTPQRAIPRLKLLNDGDLVDHATASVYHRNSSSDGVAVNIGTIIPLVASDTGIEMETEVLETTGSLVNDSGQFSMLSLESIWSYTYNFPVEVSDVDTDEAIGNSQTNVIIAGVSFEAVKGTGKVELVENFDYTGAIVNQTSIDSWADTSIQVDISAGALADTNCYLFVTNDTGSKGGIAVQVGLPPETYQEAVEAITPSASHYWMFQNSYDDEIGSATANVSSGGTPTFDTSIKLCKGDSHSLLLNNIADYISPADQSDMNTSSQNRRYFGGWFQLSNVSQGLAVIYEEGAQVNNIAFLNGFGNNAMVQIANASDDYVQLFLDKPLAPLRTYHIMWKFVASGQDNGISVLWLDGVEQSKTKGNPWETAQLDSHSGNITWGHEGTENLKVGDDRGPDATTIAFVSPVSCSYAHWVNWSGQTITPTQIREQLFEKGARADYTIAADTEANMQTAFDAYEETEHTDTPCVFEIAECSEGDFTLVLNGVTFVDRVSIQFRYVGTNTLTLRLENGSGIDTDKFSTPFAGTIDTESPVSFTIEGLIAGSIVSLFDNETVNGNDLDTRLAYTASSGTSFAYAHNGVANDIIVEIIKVGYEESVTPYTLGGSDQTLTVSQQVDVNA